MDVTTILKILKANRGKITKQQVKTIRGQALSGDTDGARKGLKKLGLYD